jgi:putative CocE/NonD family hydrolase
MKRTPLLISAVLALSCSQTHPAPAPAPPRPPPAPSKAVSPEVAPSLFTQTDVMIPMRDGIKLETVIFVPKAANKSLPFLLRREPYGIPKDEKWLVRPDLMEPLVADGYIFVVQNLRGRFKSEGSFVMARPPRSPADPRAIDESTDAYDTIEWLLHNVPSNNGRVGMLGISYSGWTTTMALLDPHPALKAASPQASPADQFIGDDFHHNGAFRLSYGFEYSALLESEKTRNTNFNFDHLDTYTWYLALGPLANANERHFHGKIATWNDFVEHPNRDAFWERQAYASYLKKTTVPNLNVAGWWDQEDFYGPVKIYDLLEQNDAEHRNYLVVGPWNHGGWGFGKGRSLGDIDFGSDTASHFRAKIEAPWFAYWLHDKGKLDQPEALVFETGSNRWRSFESWPPKAGMTRKRLYLRAGGALSFDPPPETSADAVDSYISDPANPVPYVRRPIAPSLQNSMWRVWLVQDQRFVDHRPDVLTWHTDVLTEDVVIGGDIITELYASTSGSDSDWIVKLIDVYPEGPPPPPPDKAKLTPAPPDLRGYQLMIANDVLRGRFRNNFARPEPIPPNQVVKYTIDLHTNAHAFLKGHRIMVQVQSTWFPVIDRNPQKYVDNIFKAKASDYVKATQRVARSRAAPSAVILPILTQ